MKGANAMHLPFLSIERFGGGDSRWWVRFGKPRHDPIEGYHRFPLVLRVELPGKPRPHAGITYSRNEDHTLYLGLGFEVYVSWDRRKGYDWPGQEWGVSIRGERLAVEWACDDSEMHYFTDAKGKRRSKPGAGWEWHCYLLDALLGDRRYSSVETGRETLTLVMPEGRYRADCVVDMATWQRPRWPWWPLTRRIERATIDFTPPVGIPGKGENSYDCDDDATYSVTTPIKRGSLHATLEAFALDTLKTRQHRGGLNWAPADGWPEVVAAD